MNTSEIRILALAPTVFNPSPCAQYSIANAPLDFRRHVQLSLAFGDHFKHRRRLNFGTFGGLAHFAASKYGRTSILAVLARGAISPRVLDLGTPEARLRERTTASVSRLLRCYLHDAPRLRLYHMFVPRVQSARRRCRPASPTWTEASAARNSRVVFSSAHVASSNPCLR